MPFRAYKAFFKPDELDSLNDAFDAAWQRVRRSTSGAMTPSRATDLRNRIAKIILASACTGERNRERLTEIALRGVSGAGTASEKKLSSREAAHIDQN
jgi:cytochrome P450